MSEPNPLNLTTEDGIVQFRLTLDMGYEFWGMQRHGSDALIRYVDLSEIEVRNGWNAFDFWRDRGTKLE